MNTSVDVYFFLNDAGVLSKKRREIYAVTCLFGYPVSANEIANEALKMGFKHAPSSVNIHPRLGELVTMGWLRVAHIAPCRVTGNNVAHYERNPNVEERCDLQRGPTRKELEESLEKARSFFRAVRDKWGHTSAFRQILDSL